MRVKDIFYVFTRHDVREIVPVKCSNEKKLEKNPDLLFYSNYRSFKESNLYLHCQCFGTTKTSFTLIIFCPEGMHVKIRINTKASPRGVTIEVPDNKSRNSETLTIIN